MNTTDAIELKKLEARFTRAKQAVTDTPTPAKEKAYQKAKRELAAKRISLRSPNPPHSKSGDAAVTPATLKVKATDPKKGS